MCTVNFRLPVKKPYFLNQQLSLNSFHKCRLPPVGLNWSAPQCGSLQLPGWLWHPSLWEVALVCLIRDSGRAWGWTSGLSLLSACFSGRRWLRCFLCVCVSPFSHLPCPFHLRSLLPGEFFSSQSPRGEACLCFLPLKQGTGGPILSCFP